MDFSDLYTRYARDVHRFAVWLSGDPALAEDLTAETFVHALCAAAPLRVDTVKAYLFTITRNLYQDFTHRRRRLISISGVHEPGDPAPSAYHTMENRQAVDKVLRAIQRLPEPQRESSRARGRWRSPLRADRPILGCSVVAVKVRIHRARLQLKADLETQEK